MADTHIIDGKGFAADLRGRVAMGVARLKAERGLIPGLAVVLVGEDPASQVYVRTKGEKTREAGMHSVTHRLAADTTQADLLRLVNQLNHDPSIHGILVQLPLPRHLAPAPVIAAIHPDKDVDGLHVVNAGRLATGQRGLVPCTPLGCAMLLKDVVGDLRGLHAVVLGRSNLVGKPAAQLLTQYNATVTIAHSHTVDIKQVCRSSDIVVAAVGRPEMVRGDWIKEGAVVIDVGINRVPALDPDAAAAGKTRLVGDVAYEECIGHAGAITPVPGGVGPMTVACLLLNTLTAACLQQGIKVPDEALHHL